MNTDYKDYPFVVNGVKFISRINANSPFAGSLAKMPAPIVTQLNIDAVTELIGNASLFTRDELLDELARVNDGATHAFILLDEESN
jgi:hypothetical protein